MASTLAVFFFASVFASATHFLANFLRFASSSEPNALPLTFLELATPGFSFLNPSFSLAS